MPSMIRRMRTRLPTYLSTGLGALVDIANTPWDYAGRSKEGVTGFVSGASTVKSCVEVGANQCRKFEQCTDGSDLEWFRGAECEWRSRSVNWRISVCQPFCQHSKPRVNHRREFHFAARRLVTKIRAEAIMMAREISPARA